MYRHIGQLYASPPVGQVMGLDYVPCVRQHQKLGSDLAVFGIVADHDDLTRR